MRSDTILTITGRVQGVGFRAETIRKANELGLAGYVSNLSEGSVEICVQQDPQELIDHLKKTFSISEIKIAEKKSEKALTDFRNRDAL